jgi:predicted ribosomally synthesized peptide with nif11-like leader
MSEEQLAALLAKLKDDVGLQEKLKGAADLDALLAIAKDAGFEISKAAWLRYQANQTLELSDEELEEVAGGHKTYFLPTGFICAACGLMTNDVPTADVCSVLVG